MPGYFTKQLKKYKNEVSKRPQHAPYPSAPNKYGAAAQEPIKQMTQNQHPQKESTYTTQDPLTPPSSWHYQHWQANKPTRRRKQ